MNKKILIVVSHPDDEVLGCFGTIARLIQEGYEAYTLILGEGKTSRDNINDSKYELALLNKEIKKANHLIYWSILGIALIALSYALINAVIKIKW